MEGAEQRGRGGAWWGPSEGISCQLALSIDSMWATWFPWSQAGALT